jgi:outer membrane protein assembly factor BamB
VATIPYPSYGMKQPKILFLVAIALLPLVLVSCSSIFGGASISGGWAGTAFRGGIIYAGTTHGRVVAINSSTQSQQWDYTVNSATYTTPVVDGDLVYVGTYSGQVLALSTLARSQNLTFPQQRYGEWEWDCPLDNARSNAIVADLLVSGDTIYVSSSNGRVYSLDKEFGDQNWESKVLDERQRKLWTSPVIEGNALYVSTLDGHIYALSVETGQLLDWSFKSEAGFTSSPVIYQNTIFLGSFDRHLYAVEIGSNVSMWKFPQEKPAGNWFWASPVVNEGIVYAGCLDGKLYAINATTGKEIWSYTTEDQEGKPSPITSSPVLMGNVLIVANESGNVYVFDLNAEIEGQGVPSKTISIGADVNSSFCAQEGLVYIRGEDNQLYVVDVDKAKVSWKIPLAAEG